MPANFADGCVRETTRRFQVASCASMSPALRPMRGSGLGAAADIFAAGEGAEPDIDDEPEWHPDATTRAAARATEEPRSRKSIAMRNSPENDVWVTNAPKTKTSRASA